MKKQLFILFSAFITLNCNAQLKVQSNGNVGIGMASNVVPASKLALNCVGDSNYVVSIEGTTYGLRAKRQGQSSYTWGWGVEGVSENFSGGMNIGVKAQGYVEKAETGSGRSFGVYASGGFATSGYNYALFGYLSGNSNGAGVYGSSWSNDRGLNLDGRYAGFFRGNTKVNGNLTVTGNISGTILSAAVSPQDGNDVSGYLAEEKESLSAKLSALSLVSYYEPQKNSARTKPASTDADTTEIADPLTSIEVQRLTKQHYGLSVNQLEQLFPDLVYDLEDGTKAVNYMEMIPLLVGTINELRTEVELLKANHMSLKTRSRTETISIETADEAILSLSQNNPNPFSEQTSIEVSVPESVHAASLYIYDMSGKQIKRIDIMERGITRISVTSEGLTEGMYLYSLIADGKMAGTKKMILTK